MKTGVVLCVLALSAISACTLVHERGATAPQWKASPGKPTYYINSVAISGDGTKTVGGTFFHSYSQEPDSPPQVADPSSDGTFGTYCYDNTGRLLWKDEFTGWQGVYWVDISTDGSHAASGGWYSENPYFGFVRAFDASSGARLLDYRTAKRVNQVVLSADGSWLLSAAENVGLFHLVSGAYQLTSQYTPAANDTIESAAMSADGTTVVCSDYSGKVYLLSNVSGTLTLQQSWAVPGGGYSHSVRMTPSGAYFAAGGTAGNFYLFKTANFVSTGQPVSTCQPSGASSVYGVAVADDGSAFVGIANITSNSSSGMIYYAIPSGTQATVKWNQPTAHNPNSASLNSSKSLLAVADGHPDGTPGKFYLFNAANGDLQWQYTTSNMSWPIMIAAGGSAVAAGSDDSYIYYFKP